MFIKALFCPCNAQASSDVRSDSGEARQSVLTGIAEEARRRLGHGVGARRVPRCGVQLLIQSGFLLRLIWGSSRRWLLPFSGTQAGLLPHGLVDTAPAVVGNREVTQWKIEISAFFLHIFPTNKN